MMKILRVLFVVLSCFASSGLAVENVLFLSPVPSASHHIFNRVLALGLVEKGYNVTFLSADLSTEQVENLHYIHLEKAHDIMARKIDGTKIFENSKSSSIIGLMFMVLGCNAFYEGIIKSKGLETILNYPDDFKFDVILHDATYGPTLLPLMARFNYPPLVSLTPFMNSPFTTEIIGGNKYPAYIPHYTLDYSTNMNLFQRSWNYLHYYMDTTMRGVCLKRFLQPSVREHFKFNFPSFEELSLRSTILLVNIDSAIDYPEPIPPNMIPVGGLQIVPPRKLPTHLDEFISSGEKGTILISLGPIVKSSYLSEKIVRYFLISFSAFPKYNFLWDFESNVADRPPENVMMYSSLPTNDILAHPNIKAFMTHSGLMSTQEAYWHGVPMICLPFYGDQFVNAKKSVEHGVAVRVDRENLTVDHLIESIHTVLSDPKFATNARKLSQLFQDKPEKPLEKAIWWIEYVMRNSDSLEKLRSPTIEFGHFELNSYDIIILLFAAVFALLYLFYKSMFWAILSIRPMIKMFQRMNAETWNLF